MSDIYYIGDDWDIPVRLHKSGEPIDLSWHKVTLKIYEYWDVIFNETQDEHVDSNKGIVVFEIPKKVTSEAYDGKHEIEIIIEDMKWKKKTIDAWFINVKPPRW